MIAQIQEVSKETELEAEIKNLISKKNNFSEFKTEKITTYNNLIEYGITVRPLNWSYKLSAVENRKNKNAAFVYANNVSSEGLYFLLGYLNF